MMSMGHLVWIVPVAGSIGYAVAACLAAAKRADEESERQAICLECIRLGCPHRLKSDDEIV